MNDAEKFSDRHSSEIAHGIRRSISAATYGYIFQFWRIPILKSIGWKGAQNKVIKLLKELV